MDFNIRIFFQFNSSQVEIHMTVQMTLKNIKSEPKFYLNVIFNFHFGILKLMAFKTLCHSLMGRFFLSWG